ncbi:MAG: hypothetical protein ABI823_02835 [Bryobacteraceae bacterium]
MKRFTFPLERVLALRREQVQLVELQLERILADRRRLDREEAELRETESRSAGALLAQRVIDPVELIALSSFRHWMERQCLALTEQKSECDQKAAAQRARLNAARQAARLVEKLRERRWAEWQSGFQKELEEQAAESFLSRWNRERGLSRGAATADSV